MKLRKRIVAMGAAMIMAVSMMSIGASAYNLHYSQGAPTSDNVLSQNSYTGNYFGTVSHVYVHSQNFSRLLSGGYLYAKNVNSGNGTSITAGNTTYTINTNVYLSGAMIHNYYELRNYTTSKSISASGYDTFD